MMVFGLTLAGCGGAPTTPLATTTPTATPAPTATPGPCIDMAKVSDYLADIQEHLALADLTDPTMEERGRVADELEAMSVIVASIAGEVRAARPDIADDLGVARHLLIDAAIEILLDDPAAAGASLGEATDLIDSLGSITAADRC
jgi:hypothetical protein